MIVVLVLSFDVTSRAQSPSPHCLFVVVVILIIKNWTGISIYLVYFDPFKLNEIGLNQFPTLSTPSVLMSPKDSVEIQSYPGK